MPEQDTTTVGRTALHLTVNNHPGVMSHVCGLFARRAFNLEGILVTPIADGATCSMWLMVNEDARMEQVVRQVRNLHDILDVEVACIDGEAFCRLSANVLPRERAVGTAQRGPWLRAETVPGDPPGRREAV